MINGADSLAFEPYIRVGAFLGLFTVMAVLERISPRRALRLPKNQRWFSNLGIVVLNSIMVRLILPLGPVAFANLWAEHNWGLFNLIGLPFWVEVVFAIVIMDFAIWIQHLLAHRLPWFWQVHLVHHTDLDYDVTTGARFHPLEIFISLAIKFVVIAIIGASPVAVLLFEVILNTMAIFNHANVHLPRAFDAVLRRLVVTPDFHRVHHSDLALETNSNYGFNLSIWDRIFGTYVAQPQRGHTGMTIGLPIFLGQGEHRLDKMLTQPFRNGKD